MVVRCAAGHQRPGQRIPKAVSSPLPAWRYVAGPGPALLCQPWPVAPRSGPVVHAASWADPAGKVIIRRRRILVCAQRQAHDGKDGRGADFSLRSLLCAGCAGRCVHESWQPWLIRSGTDGRARRCRYHGGIVRVPQERLGHPPTRGPGPHERPDPACSRICGIGAGFHERGAACAGADPGGRGVR
jgi:hypothetical protein